MRLLFNKNIINTLKPIGSSPYSTHVRDVRVRFAPSPTGHLHIGGLRTALYNFLYARNKRGKFILRIEDTDRTRLVPGATEAIIDDLLWSGIEIDEGPSIFGGQYGPYIQSERKDIYEKFVQQLLENGSAYRCFCTERRLELLRKEALRIRQVPRYDNKCRHLSATDVDVLLERSTPFCIRFQLTDYSEPLNDLIYGQVHHNVSELEGDPVIMKSDHYPTYHFANVVDDHLMRITHVLRGAEWQISTTKHMLLYRAFGWQPPEYGHLPLIVNPDGTKLSKRQGDIGIKYFREKGYYPEAFVNYVMTAGGCFQKEQLQRLDSIIELAAQFSIEKINSRPSRLSPEILDDFNRLRIVKLLSDEVTANQLINTVRTLVKEAFPRELNLDLNEEHIRNVLMWASKRLSLLSDLTAPDLCFLWVRPTSVHLVDITREKLDRLQRRLALVDFSKHDINNCLKDFAKEEQIHYATFMKTLRGTLSGLKEGPAVADMMEILGKDVVMERLRCALNAAAGDHEKSQHKASKARQ